AFPRPRHRAPPGARSPTFAADKCPGASHRRRRFRAPRRGGRRTGLARASIPLSKLHERNMLGLGPDQPGPNRKEKTRLSSLTIKRPYGLVKILRFPKGSVPARRFALNSRKILAIRRRRPPEEWQFLVNAGSKPSPRSH